MKKIIVKHCEECNGKGIRKIMYRADDGIRILKKPIKCKTCNGSGHIVY